MLNDLFRYTSIFQELLSLKAMYMASCQILQVSLKAAVDYHIASASALRCFII